MDESLRDDWSTSANDAVHISLVTAGHGGASTLHSFPPRFTYPIFGEQEQIFGYKGLDIDLRYNACDMRPHLRVKYDQKFRPVGETEADDVKAKLEEFLPTIAFDKEKIFESQILNADIYQDWKPPGTLMEIFTKNGEEYEIWKGNLSRKPVQQHLRRLQILISLFIEGGTPIDLQDDEWTLKRWVVFTLYRKSKITTPGTSPYIFMGYSTVYRYYYFEPRSPAPGKRSGKGKAKIKTEKTDRPAIDYDITKPEMDMKDLPCRSRISQFVILPPFQHGGHGSHLYSRIFNYYLHRRETVEITVEDPNEAFDDMRDVIDLVFLRSVPSFASLHINHDISIQPSGPIPHDIIDPDAYDGCRRVVKIAPRQFARLVEMEQLSRFPSGIHKLIGEQEETENGQQPGAASATTTTSTEGAGSHETVEDDLTEEHHHAFHLWQLMCKARLYQHNRDSLAQLDIEERIPRLEATLTSVALDYLRLLEMAARRSAQIDSGEGGQVSSVGASGRGGGPDEANANEIQAAGNTTTPDKDGRKRAHSLGDAAAVKKSKTQA